MKCNKNADTLFFYCYLLQVNMKKYSKKHLWVQVLKKVKNSRFVEYFTTTSTQS